MPRTWWIGACGIFLLTMSGIAQAGPEPKTLRVYGPGGPHHVLKECADLFETRHGIEVSVNKALPHELKQKLPEDGDLYYAGAEYMLEEFNRDNPGVLDMNSVEKLHPRRVGIIVRRGNPLGIRGVADLRREEIDLLDVKLENMRQLHDALAGKPSDVRQFVYTGQDGVKAWLSIPEIDAWITYKSWHVALESASDFIELPGDQALRFTPMALTRRTPYRQEALLFIKFLKSEEARGIFREHGWD